MAIPKLDKNKKVDDFLGGAKATKADTNKQTSTRPKGRPKGPAKRPLNARLPLGLMETISQHSSGNISFFAEKVFREYFERNNIEITED